MVQYLHFRILEFPLMIVLPTLQSYTLGDRWCFDSGGQSHERGSPHDGKIIEAGFVVSFAGRITEVNGGFSIAMLDYQRVFLM
jgi:hypothetical protein